MTLVEVVAGLALLATVLVGILAVKARCAEKMRIAARQRDALAAADAMLSTWWQNVPAFPRAGAGIVPGHSELAWHTRKVSSPAASALGSEVVRLEIAESESREKAQPLAAVELLLPKETNHVARVYAR